MAAMAPQVTMRSPGWGLDARALTLSQPPARPLARFTAAGLFILGLVVRPLP